MKTSRTMRSVTLSSALDFFDDCSIPVGAWLASGNKERHQRYITACMTYLCSEFADNELRQQPHVAYDVSNDSSYFIFKQENNGTCILVGEYLPKIPLEEML